MTNRSRLSALLLATSVIVAACSSGSETSPATTVVDTTVPAEPDPTLPTTDPSPPNAASTSTIEPAPTTTTEPPPSTVPGEPDWFQVVTDLSTRMHEIVTTSAADRISEVAIIGGQWETVTGSAIRNSAERGETTVGLPNAKIFTVERIDTPPDFDPANVVYLSVTFEAVDLTNARIVDSNGDVVFQLVNDDSQPGDVLTATWILGRTPDGWRVTTIFEL